LHQEPRAAEEKVARSRLAWLSATA